MWPTFRRQAASPYSFEGWSITIKPQLRVSYELAMPAAALAVLHSWTSLLTMLFQGSFCRAELKNCLPTEVQKFQCQFQSLTLATLESLYECCQHYPPPALSGLTLVFPEFHCRCGDLNPFCDSNLVPAVQHDNFKAIITQNTPRVKNQLILHNDRICGT